jgi:hypothetical protein
MDDGRDDDDECSYFFDDDRLLIMHTYTHTNTEDTLIARQFSVAYSSKHIFNHFKYFAVHGFA